MSASNSERVGVCLNPLAQPFGQRGRTEQLVAERNRLIKGSCLRPETQSAETVEKRFLAESLRGAALAQGFFNLRGFGEFTGSLVSARLFAQQLGPNRSSRSNRGHWHHKGLQGRAFGLPIRRCPFRRPHCAFATAPHERVLSVCSGRPARRLQLCVCVSRRSETGVPHCPVF